MLIRLGALIRLYMVDAVLDLLSFNVFVSVCIDWLSGNKK